MQVLIYIYTYASISPYLAFPDFLTPNRLPTAPPRGPMWQGNIQLVLGGL